MNSPIKIGDTVQYTIAGAVITKVVTADNFDAIENFRLLVGPVRVIDVCADDMLMVL